MALVPVASAQETRADVETKVEVRVQNTSSTSTVKTRQEVQPKVRPEAVDTQIKARVEARTEAVEMRAKALANATTTRREISAGEHKSEVASFVRSLLLAADRDGGIGEEVRIVARLQEKSASSTEEAILKVKSREGIRTFLIGSDYKNLGRIRAELATTTANIAKLERLMNEAQTVEAKAELEAQIKALEDSQAKVKAFVEARENTFSVFGWAAKLFVR